MAAAKVRVRMYEVGFGDCFLLTLPTSGGSRKVLVDCGSIKKGSKAFADIKTQLFADLEEGEPDQKPRVDVVIATHRHKDHVSGFDDARWRDVEVGEVWLPWTEDTDDPTANQLRASLEAFAQRLHDSVKAGPGLGALDVLCVNALENAAAMDTLREGFRPHKRHGPKTKRIYLPDAQLSRTLVSAALPGVGVHVMGPSRDKADIVYMEPRSTDTHYIRFAGERSSAKGRDGLFASTWTYEPAGTLLTEREKREIAKIGTGLEAAVAAWIDGALNNTSLMLMLKVQGKHLFLPGDSQWGPWMRALKDSGWQALLRKTRFYKVGHHGSYNATPPDFVQHYLGSGVWALVSVTPHGSYKQVPKTPLLNDLKKKKRRVIRSDQELQAPAGATVRKGLSIDVAL